MELGLKHLILFVVIAVFEYADSTEIPAGNVSGIWEKSKSPYNVNGEIVVPAGSSLIIENGVQVFITGGYKLTVNGNLKAVGTQNDSIIFSSSQNNTQGWRGLEVDAVGTIPDSLIFKYCRFSNVKKSGSGAYGGALLVKSIGALNLSIDNCMFLGNSAYQGGAIYAHYSSKKLKIKNCSFVRNRAENKGGAIYGNQSNIDVLSSNFYDNIAQGSGGAYCGINSTDSFKKNTFYMNKSFQGGAVYGFSAGLIFCENVFRENQTNNVTSQEGGAVYYYCDTGDSVIFLSNIFDGNKAVRGGGLYINNANARMVNNLFCHNESVQGCALYQKSSPDGIRLSNNTVVDNSGEFVCYLLGGYTLQNNIVRNGAEQEIYTANDVGTTGKRIVGYSNIQGGLTSFSFASGSSFNGTYVNNINADPLFTNSGDHPYSLQAGSPCKNAGTPDTTGLKLPAGDLAGFARVQDGRVDIGAYEYGSQVSIPVNLKKKSEVIDCYPNPFNNSTKVCFVIDKPAATLVTVYNSSGQKVRELLNSELPAGLHRIAFNADDLSTGIYFVRLYAQGIAASRKLIILK